MTRILSGLHTLRVISPYPNGLPDGSNIVATKEGFIIFYSDFVFENVLCVWIILQFNFCVATYRLFQLYYSVHS